MPESTALEHAQSEAHVAEPLHRPWMAWTCSLAALAVLAFGFVSLRREDSPLPAIARYALSIALPRWHITEPVNEIVYGTRGFDTFGETFLLIAAVVSVATLARHREPRGEYVGEEEAGKKEQAESDPDRSGGAGDTDDTANTDDTDEARDTGDTDDTDDADRRDRRSRKTDARATREEREARRAEAEEAGEDTASDQSTADEDDGADDLAASRRTRFAADTNPLGSEAPEHSEAMTVIVRVAARAAVVILGVAAVYLCARGFSPGGGFPAGAALAGVGLLLYAALGYRAVARAVRPEVLEPIELAGALIIIGLAVTGLFLRGSVMANWIPLAPVQTIASGGLLQAFSVMELVEVATGLSIAVFAMLAMKHDWTPDLPDVQEDTGQDSASGGDEDEAGKRSR